jgi:two-component system chemotaxis response regulator CheY
MDSLIVEDDQITRTILEKWLKSFGKVEVARNGEEGFDAYDVSLKSGYPYALICLDIHMPGLSGHQVLEKIRKAEAAMGLTSGKGAKVLMVTADGNMDSVMKAYKFECDGYLQKPLNKEKLMKALSDLGFSMST